jgi:hypothetical protein
VVSSHREPTDRKFIDPENPSGETRKISQELKIATERVVAD